MDPKQVTEAIQRAAVAHCGEPYVIDSENIDTIDKVAHWIAGVERVGVDLGKGIALLGNVGSGKTLLMKCVSDVMRAVHGFHHGFGVVSCPRLVRDFNPKDTGGWDGIRNWVRGARVCYDELGRETEAIHMGLRTQLLPEIIEIRYESTGQPHGPQLTHLVSNMDVPALRDHLGPRAWSRVQHLCNIWPLGASANSKDRRLKAKPITPAPVEEQRDNVYSAIHPDLMKRLRAAGIGHGTRTLAKTPTSHHQSREGDLQAMAEMITTLDDGELAAFEDTIRKQNDHTTAEPYLHLFGVERARRNTAAR